MTTFNSDGHKVIEHGFFSDPSLDFQTRTVLGKAVRGASEVGEVLATVARINGEDDWAKEWAVLTPVVDALISRPDVDARRLTGYGISQAGYWLPRALAYEHRLVAAVADPGVVDVSLSWTQNLGEEMRAMLEKGDRADFNRYMQIGTTHSPELERTLTFRGRPYQHEDWYDLFHAVQQYRIDPATAALITTPLLITDPDDEQFFPGQPRQLAKLIADRAHLVAFSAQEGANYHCQPMGRLLTEERMFNWLEDFVR
jgi:hypothetical protein